MYLLSPGKGREEKGREGKRWKKRVTFLFEPFNVFAFSMSRFHSFSGASSVWSMDMGVFYSTSPLNFVSFSLRIQ